VNTIDSDSLAGLPLPSMQLAPLLGAVFSHLLTFHIILASHPMAATLLDFVIFWNAERVINGFSLKRSLGVDPNSENLPTEREEVSRRGYASFEALSNDHADSPWVTG
jgi:hypothetical protein